MSNVEQTLSIIKPDAVERNLDNEIKEMFKVNGFRIVKEKKIQIEKSEAEKFYKVHETKPFYNDLCAYLSSGPIVVMILEKENAVLANRDLMGATNPKDALEGIMSALKTDRAAFLKDFVKNFYNAKQTGVSQAQLDYAWNIGAFASPRATVECAKAWAGTDFRSECKNVKVPTLIVHGDADQIVPIKTSGAQAAKLIPDNEYHVVQDAPHGLNLTHREELNRILLDFFKS